MNYHMYWLHLLPQSDLKIVHVVVVLLYPSKIQGLNFQSRHVRKKSQLYTWEFKEFVCTLDNKNLWQPFVVNCKQLGGLSTEHIQVQPLPLLSHLAGHTVPAILSTLCTSPSTNCTIHYRCRLSLGVQADYGASQCHLYRH